MNIGMEIEIYYIDTGDLDRHVTKLGTYMNQQMYTQIQLAQLFKIAHLERKLMLLSNRMNSNIKIIYAVMVLHNTTVAKYRTFPS